MVVKVCKHIVVMRRWYFELFKYSFDKSFGNHCFDGITMSRSFCAMQYSGKNAQAAFLKELKQYHSPENVSRDYKWHDDI